MEFFTDKKLGWVRDHFQGESDIDMRKELASMTVEEQDGLAAFIEDNEEVIEKQLDPLNELRVDSMKDWVAWAILDSKWSRGLTKLALHEVTLQTIPPRIRNMPLYRLYIVGCTVMWPDKDARLSFKNMSSHGYPRELTIEGSNFIGVELHDIWSVIPNSVEQLRLSVVDHESTTRHRSEIIATT